MIPRTALYLALGGLVPFLVCAGVALSGNQVVLRGAEDEIMLRYGIIILAFMSGVLWGFATNASGKMAAVAYGLSVLPALWAFFTAVGPTPQALGALIPGFYGLLALDYYFWRAGLAPPWWLRLRLPLTAVVMVTLGIGTYM
ncbi:MAG: hypothetical protein RLZZ607_226 [Pseudomonadota bacterium]|jgi:hypothetical protein